MLRIAINGFGRIGRLAFRNIFKDPRFEVVAINDLTNPQMLAYLLKYDSVQKAYHGHEIFAGENFISVDGIKIPVFAEPDAKLLPWKEFEVDIVLECTGFYTSREKSMAHIEAGAARVLISAPAGNDVPTVVYGTNHEILKASDLIVSGASCTTNCLAPMAKALNEYRELRTGFMTTIHAYTGDQMLLDGPHRKGDFRRARAGAVNIVPTSSGAAKTIGL
ncbi:MAG: aldehyde dehydrogenase, partial [Clostridiales bacterium]|nr:aldehyde dehydrogenase [Clostridiales bacterium]